MKQITIYDLIPLLKNGWVAMDWDGSWWWFDYKPTIDKDSLQWQDFSNKSEKIGGFNIAPFDGSWEDSLIKVEHKEEE